MGFSDKERQTRYIALCSLVITIIILTISKTASEYDTAIVHGHSSTTTRQTTATQQRSLNQPFSFNLQAFYPIVLVHSHVIEPDLSRQTDYRTSQLVVLNDKVYPSRKVFYKSVSKPRAVIVVPLDANDSPEVLATVLAERKEYCEKHGYGLFARYTQDFAADRKPAPEALGLAPFRMLRQAMVAFPTSEWFWLLGTDMHIADRDMKLMGTDLSYLKKAMRPDLETEKVTVTNFAKDPTKAEIIVTSDPRTQMISSRFLAVRQSLPGQLMLELAADPLFQSWEAFFSSSDPAGATLTHISRWHPMLVNSMALVSPHYGGTLPCSTKTGKPLVCTRTGHEWLAEKPDLSLNVLG